MKKRVSLKPCAFYAVTVFLGATATQAIADVAICATEQAIACTPFEPCARSLPGGVNLPVLIKLDTEAALVTSLRGTGEERSSAIASSEEIEGGRVFQGVDTGAPWSMKIDNATARLTGTIVGDDDAFIIFGECSWELAK